MVKISGIDRIHAKSELNLSAALLDILNWPMIWGKRRLSCAGPSGAWVLSPSRPGLVLAEV